MLRTLIFDVDGTSADIERDGHRVAFNHELGGAGIVWRWDVPRYADLLRGAFAAAKQLHEWHRNMG